MPSSGPRDRLYSSRPTCRRRQLPERQRRRVRIHLVPITRISTNLSTSPLRPPPRECAHAHAHAASDDWRQSEEAGALPLSSAHTHTHTHNTVVVPNPGGGRPPGHPMHSHPESPAHPTSLSASDDEGRYASTAARRRLLLRPSISRGHAGVVALPPAAVCACASRRHSRVRNGAARLSSPHRAVAGS